nr:NADH dehydrogenase subunit 3 [Pholas orientalis]
MFNGDFMGKPLCKFFSNIDLLVSEGGEYGHVCGYLAFCSALTFAMGVLWSVISFKPKKVQSKKTSFECGFDALSNCSVPFTLRFYVIALLFLLVDVELILLFPAVFSKGIIVGSMGWFYKTVLAVFLGVMIVGLFHEENEGSLEWKRDEMS